MGYALIRFIWGFWFVISTAMVWYSFATFIFAKGEYKSKGKLFGQRLYHAALWPLSVWSKNGRDRLVTLFLQGETV